MQTHTRKTILPVFFTIGAAILFSCNDKEPTADDKTGPDISVALPDDNTVYAPGDTIYYQADIEDDSELSEMSVSLINGTDTVLLWPDATVNYGNIKSYTINNWDIDIWNVNADATIQFKAVDKHDNSSTADVPVQLTM